MDELLSPEQEQLRESAARLCADFGGAKRARALRDSGEGFDRAAWKAIGDAGWLSALVPETRGGLGLGAIELYVLLEQIGRHLVMVPLLESAAASWVLGRARSTALDEVLGGARLVLPALQADGWDFHRVSKSLAATAQGNQLLVGGAIAAVPFAQAADDLLVQAEASGEPLLCLMRRDDPACRVAVHRAVDGTQSGRVTFTDAAVEESHIVARGDEAEALASQLADLLALGASIELLGLSESALALTLEHIKTRKQFGHPLGSFQALQHRVVDCYVDLEVDRSLLHRICTAWDDGTAAPPMMAAAKARCSRSAAEIMRTGLQLHGAIGYTDEHDIGILFKRALVRGASYGNEFTQSDRFARLTREEAQ